VVVVQYGRLGSKVCSRRACSVVFVFAVVVLLAWRHEGMDEKESIRSNPKVVSS
jgi:hypothetical protein